MWNCNSIDSCGCCFLCIKCCTQLPLKFEEQSQQFIRAPECPVHGDEHLSHSFAQILPPQVSSVDQNTGSSVQQWMSRKFRENSLRATYPVLDPTTTRSEHFRKPQTARPVTGDIFHPTWGWSSVTFPAKNYIYQFAPFELVKLRLITRNVYMYHVRRKMFRRKWKFKNSSAIEIITAIKNNNL